MNLDKKIATRQSYGEALAELGEKNKKIVVLDADLSESTKTCLFAKKFPNRFFEMGIAEQDMMSTAAGFAASGMIAYASSFAVFAAGRAYDQIRNSICYPKLNVKICATHAGVTVGEDGATHQMLEDIGLMRGLPNMTVISTSDDTETKWAVEEISKIDGPVYLRLGRYATPVIYDENQKFEIGKGIEKEGINIRVVDIHTIKPIDRDIIIKSAKETKRIITIEEHNIIGGLGSAVCEVLSEEYPTKVTRMGIKDRFGTSAPASELIHYFMLDAEAIVDEIKNV